MTTTTNIEQRAINTIRTLAMDAVEKANSGHPGTPMALAPVAYKLWSDVLRYDPAAPQWPGRDRFLLSCGHASMLLYAVLHVAGVENVDREGRPLGRKAITLEDIKNFRQLHSPCAGHPEYGDASGIETTTGPLGQGVGNSVGMAIAANWLANRFDRPGFALFGFNVFAFASDGDLMEGIGCEAASLAGHLRLSNLCWIYDDNGITIEGSTDLAFTEDVATRFKGLGWHVEHVEDANDLEEIGRALDAFQQNDAKPTLIVLRSHIAWGAPNKQDTHGAHGAPLGEEEIRLTKRAYGWPENEQFVVPDDVLAHFQEKLGKRGRQQREAWDASYAEYAEAHPDLAEEWECLQARTLPDGWEKSIPTFEPSGKGLATRASSGQVLNAVAEKIPWLLGGSADLAPSNNTRLKFDEAGGDFGPDNYGGRNLHFGVREHATASACNGMALANLRPYAGTFFVFTDYMRPSMRLAAIMRQPVLYVLTHDSIGLGEDGPTHQPVEHLAALRAIPRLVVIRPGDANEVAEAYRAALSLNDRPVALVLTRQAVPTLDRSKYGAASGVARGGYILADTDAAADVILLASGSELSIAVEAASELNAAGTKTRVVSMPSWELFDEQDQAYRDKVLPPNVTARVAVEAGVRLGWDKYLGTKGQFVGMADFGASAPGKQLYEQFGITAAAVAAAAKRSIG